MASYSCTRAATSSAVLTVGLFRAPNAPASTTSPQPLPVLCVFSGVRLIRGGGNFGVKEFRQDAFGVGQVLLADQQVDFGYGEGVGRPSPDMALAIPWV